LNTFAWVIIALIVGGALGAGLVWMFAVRRAGPMSVIEMKKENERFREEVNAHFVQSAQLINELTDSYKKVFDHLSDGAERLVDNEAVRERMPQVGHNEVRLRHIGAPRDFSAAGATTTRRSGEKPATSTSGREEPKSANAKSETPESGGSNPESGKASSGKRETPPAKD